MKTKRLPEYVEIARGFNHFTKETLRVVLGNMFHDIDLGFCAYGGEDVDLIYWMTVSREDGRKLTKSDMHDIQLATQAVIATVRSLS